MSANGEEIRSKLSVLGLFSPKTSLIEAKIIALALVASIFALTFAAPNSSL
jgi:hypothetical protein